MFGSEAIDEFAGMIKRIGHENRSCDLCGDARNTRRQFAEFPLHFALNFAGERARSGDEEACGVFRVLGLGEEICGHPTRVAVIGEDNGFGWAGRQIDGAIAADELLGSGNIFVTGPEDFLDAWNRLGAIGESRDGLRAADAGDFRDTKKARGGEQFGTWLRAYGDDARNTRNFGGDDSHDQRRDQRETAARDVATDAVDGANELLNFPARDRLRDPVVRKLLFPDATNLLCSFLDGIEEFRTYAPFRSADFLPGNPSASAHKVSVIEFFGPREERGIAALADTGDNFTGDEPASLTRFAARGG